MHPTLLDKIKSTLNQRGPKHIHINWLEFAAIVVNYAGAIVTTRHDKAEPPFPPMLQLYGDNKTGNKVAGKGTVKSDSEIARAVSRVLSNIQQQTTFGLTCPHVEGKNNDFADDLSRGVDRVWLGKFRSYTTEQLTHCLHPQAPARSTSTVCYRRYHPSPELLLALTTAIYEPRRVTVSLRLRIRNLGRLSLDSNITTTLSPPLLV
jgi:hypothetical protein